MAWGFRTQTRQRINVEHFNRRCVTHKVCFDTRDQALNAAEMIMERGDVQPGFHVVPYQCDQCRYWHCGNRRVIFRPEGPSELTSTAPADEQDPAAHQGDGGRDERPAVPSSFRRER